MTATRIAAGRHQDVRARDGRTLRIHQAGDPQGELVLVHHGTPGCGMIAAEWAADALARGIRLVTYDRPGYGGSDRQPGRRVADAAADAAAIADALGATRFRTWGGSGGGPHSLACAALLPDRIVAAAVLAGVAPHEAEGLDWSAGMGQDNLDEFAAAAGGEPILRQHLETVGEELTSIGPAGVVTMLRSILPDVDVDVLGGDLGEFITEWMTGGLGRGVDGWIDDDLAFIRLWGFDLSQIRMPVLFAHGARDLMIPIGHGEWLARQIPDAVVRFSAHDGHLSTLHRLPEVHAWLLEQ